MNKDDEQILVVKSDIIFKDGRWQGLKTDNLDYYIDLIKKNCEFKRRGDMENDPSYQQIIPYIVFNYQDKYFLYHYLAKAGEDRLKSDYAIGIGGHINSDDVKGNEDLLETGRDREWNEEVEYKDELIEKKLIGLIADNGRPVESAHLGIAYIYKGTTPNISVKETDKIAGELMSLEDTAREASNTKGWAPIIYKEYISKL